MLVISTADYCDSVLAGVFEILISRLQSVLTEVWSYHFTLYKRSSLVEGAIERISFHSSVLAIAATLPSRLYCNCSTRMRRLLIMSGLLVYSFIGLLVVICLVTHEYSSTNYYTNIIEYQYSTNYTHGGLTLYNHP